MTFLNSKNLLAITMIAVSCSCLQAQNTFSIVAVDEATGEVGSAGASCVDLISIGYPTDDFLGNYFPVLEPSIHKHPICHQIRQ